MHYIFKEEYRTHSLLFIGTSTQKRFTDQTAAIYDQTSCLSHLHNDGKKLTVTNVVKIHNLPAYCKNIETSEFSRFQKIIESKI